MLHGRLSFHLWRVRAALLAYHEGDLPPAKRDQLSRHLDRCAGCRSEIEALVNDERLLTEARVDAGGLEPDAARAMFRTVMAEAAPAIAARRRFTPVWGLAALAGLTAVTGTLVARHPAKPSGAAVTQDPRPRVETLPDQRVALITSDGVLIPEEVHRRVAAGQYRPRGRHGQRGISDPSRGHLVLASRDQHLAASRGDDARSSQAAPQPEIVPLEPDMDERGLLAGQIRLIVELPKLTVAVRQASAETPGFARAAALRQDGNGAWVRAQCTISSEKEGTELVYTPVATNVLVP